MSEERRRAEHPKEPAEGADGAEETPGAEKTGDPSDRAADGDNGEEKAPHPDEPAEGGEDQVDND